MLKLELEPDTEGARIVVTGDLAELPEAARVAAALESLFGPPETAQTPTEELTHAQR